MVHALRRSLVFWGLVSGLGVCFAASAHDAKTARAWRAKCASCHNANGDGKVEQGQKLGVKDFTSAEWQKANSDADIKKAIEDGKKSPGKEEGMDGYKDKLDPELIDGLVKHIRTLKK